MIFYSQISEMLSLHSGEIYIGPFFPMNPIHVPFPSWAFLNFIFNHINYILNGLQCGSPTYPDNKHWLNPTSLFLLSPYKLLNSFYHYSNFGPTSYSFHTWEGACGKFILLLYVFLGPKTFYWSPKSSLPQQSLHFEIFKKVHF
jgi:hypothetical protein